MKLLPVAFLLALGGLQLFAADKTASSVPSKELEFYFTRKVRALEGQFDRNAASKDTWLAEQGEYRRQLAEMLGLDPMPPRTDVHATKTGEFEHEGIIVENLHYQSMPGLYVTANLYRPKVIDKPLPTVLYVCGHSLVAKNGISYGNKVAYQHHGIWYAKHGFVCMVIDTVELGEIRGVHHGTYSEGRWWWLARGYTPAGVEAWAGIRGLDYLETRPDVDKTRFGVTGRSGGGAYSWWIAALDERIKAACPTAGITDLRNHVLDGCVEGHCDCMYFVNTYLWDYDKVAALVAPRALCIANTDKDGIFPLDGVMRIYDSTRRIYKLLGAEKNIGIQIAEGPHADTQALNAGEFHWMTRFLQGASPMESLDLKTEKNIEMEKLKVFKEIPKDERNTTIDQTFVPLAKAPKIPDNVAQWEAQRQTWMKQLQEKCFHGWPRTRITPTEVGTRIFNPPGDNGKLHIDEAAFYSEDQFRIYAPLEYRVGLTPTDLDYIVLNVLDAPRAVTDAERNQMQAEKVGMAYIVPRDLGLKVSNTSPASDADARTLAAVKKKQTQLRRRYYLLGLTLDGQQVWDIRTEIRSLRSSAGKDVRIVIKASGNQAGNALYASLFEDRVTELELHGLSHSHQQGPIYLNVLKYLDIPQAVAMAAERSKVVIFDNDKTAWEYPRQVAEKLGWGAASGHGLEVRDSQ